MIENLKKHWQLYLVLLLFISLAFAIGIAGYYHNKAKLPAILTKDKAILQHPEVASIDTFIDSFGQNHSEIRADANTVQQSSLKDTGVNRIRIIRQVDSALNQTDARHLMEVTQENVQLRAAVLKLRKDSANTAVLKYADRSVSFYYHPEDSTVRDLLVNLHLNQVKYNKTKWFSSKPVYDFYSDDPRVTFSGFTHFTVAIPPPTFALSTDLRGGYDFGTGRFRPSVGLNFRINQFYLEGREYYSTRTNSTGQSLAFGFRQSIF